MANRRHEPGDLPERLARIEALSRQARSQRELNRNAPCHHKNIGEQVEAASNGNWIVHNVCQDCGQKIGPPLPHADRDLTGIPKGRDARFTVPPCYLCGQFGTEYHHWLPVAIFGIEMAERGPGNWVCPKDHQWIQDTTRNYYRNGGS